MYPSKPAGVEKLSTRTALSVAFRKVCTTPGGTETNVPGLASIALSGEVDRKSPLEHVEDVVHPVCVWSGGQEMAASGVDSIMKSEPAELAPVDLRTIVDCETSTRSPAPGRRIVASPTAVTLGLGCRGRRGSFALGCGALGSAFLIELPADEPERARRFWEGLLETTLEPRRSEQGSGWQADVGGVVLGLHARGLGPGDRFSLPYFPVPDLAAALDRVRELGGEIVHPGERWAICRDSEGTPFGLASP